MRVEIDRSRRVLGEVRNCLMAWLSLDERDEPLGSNPKVEAREL